MAARVLAIMLYYPEGEGDEWGYSEAELLSYIMVVSRVSGWQGV